MVLPGLANAPREAALVDKGFAVEGLAEFWAAAAAAAKVARFCNCRALIPGERSQRGWCQTWGARLRRGWVAWLDRDSAPEDRTEHELAAWGPQVNRNNRGVCGYTAALCLCNPHVSCSIFGISVKSLQCVKTNYSS